MAEVKWIKIVTNIFDNRKIRQLESLPDGDSIIVIWMKILCLAGDTNDNGLIYFTKEIPYTEQMLASAFSRPIATVQMALSVFQKFGMIEFINDIMKIANWDKYQNVDRLNEIREYNRIAKQKERNRIACQTNVNDMSMTSQRCQDTDIDKDIDKEEDIDNTPLPPTGDSCKKTDTYSSQISEIVAFLNETVGAKYKNDTPKTRELITARIKQGFTVDNFKTVINKKYNEWKGTDFAKFLRPETLFGNKFEGYLNEKGKSDKEPSKYANVGGGITL